MDYTRALSIDDLCYIRRARNLLTGFMNSVIIYTQMICANDLHVERTCVHC